LSRTADAHNDVQPVDRLYDLVLSLLKQLYLPDKSVTATSANRDSVTPAEKNNLVRTGRTDAADALAHRIGTAIIRFNCLESTVHN